MSGDDDAGAAPSDDLKYTRRRQVDSHPKALLDARHTAGGVLLPNRLALLDRMPKDAVVAEIGVAGGEFTAEILDRTAPSRLHLIDAWDTERYATCEAEVRARFAGEIARGQVRLDKGRSTDMLATFDPVYFDWVYLDTSHTFAMTAEELSLCDRVVRPGGFIAGHDFCTGNVVTPVVYGVIPAVNEFCLSHGWRYDSVTLESHGHFSFCIRRL
ncbi:hypothetical protein DEA8626_03548 [Defluviimonas aquaemixtae]|uniref:Methyltransferase domain-containing protein n=1 Tax=Albidovulum aquaemixtae TaxID=1542388 RepID=A0A2R8BM42_9RHOB|nr:class I SAM-dependent methyltransferase [Defluviimonas aquaemixtae]SPH24496.1 hypothetical protein DEA8626_03548 [Defluviimonas aquaemixtae]